VNFDDAFTKLLLHEGGFVNHPRDPGLATNFGISQRSHPGEDIAGMTVERAKQIYKLQYWGKAGCDAVPEAVKFDLFDMAVNSGVTAAVKALQRAVGETVDGVLGPLTLQAVQTMPASRLLARFNGARLMLMADLPTWPVFGRGWVKRVASNLLAV